jgi:type I restriction enzyme S subunit
VSWKNVALGELCEVLDSKRKPITKKDRTTGSYPYYGATGIVDYVGDFIFNEKLVLIGEDGAKWESGDMTAFIADGEYWVNNHAHVIKPLRNRLLDEWLVYYFYYKDLKEFVTGLTVPKLNQGQLKTIPIPLPPLATQQKIVAKLDVIFDEIDTAKAAATANANNAEALFQSYLTEIYEEDAKNNKTVLLGSVCKVIAGQSPESKNYNNKGEGLAFYQGKKDFGDMYINPPTVWTSEITKEAVKNDILMSVRAPVGPVNIATERICIGRGLAAIRATDRINQTYLYSYLLKIEKELVGNAGAVFNSINKTQIENLKLPLPPISKQHTTVSNISFIKNNVDIVFHSQIKKIRELTLLKQSILQRAFSGELVKD